MHLFKTVLWVPLLTWETIPKNEKKLDQIYDYASTLSLLSPLKTDA